jgi:GNAT superfamily N-acetyltransferase
MKEALQFRRLPDLPPDIEALRAEAASEEFRFMDRLIAEWHANTNRFDQAGEVLLGVYEGADLLAIGGLNRDRYTDQAGIGRLRHIYVRKSARHHGVASALVRQLLKQAEGVFHSVRLRTETQEAASFYAKHGFVPVETEAASHIRMLQQPIGGRR